MWHLFELNGAAKYYALRVELCSKTVFPIGFNVTLCVNGGSTQMEQRALITACAGPEKMVPTILTERLPFSRMCTAVPL